MSGISETSEILRNHLLKPSWFYISWFLILLEWCKTCRMLVVDVINLCKGNFLPCVFYINTLKLYTQKHHNYSKYWIFHDLIGIYSFLTNNFYFIMLEKCFSIALISFSKYIHNIKTNLECISLWKCFLDPSPESVYWSCMIWLSISYK